MGKPGYVSMNLIKGFVAPALPKDCDVRDVGSDDDHALLRLPARRLASGVACCGTAMFKQITVIEEFIWLSLFPMRQLSIQLFCLLSIRSHDVRK